MNNHRSTAALVLFLASCSAEIELMAKAEGSGGGAPENDRGPDAGSRDAGSRDAGLQNIRVAIVPSAVGLTPGGAFKFSATVSGTSNTSVTWSVQEGPAGGSVDATGRYVAPAVMGAYHLIAASQADAAATATATVTVATPRPCSALPAPGTWENIEPTVGGLHGEPNGIVLDPFETGTLWLGTHGSGDATGQHRIGGVFKSVDCGASWTQVSTGLNSDKVNKGDLWSLAIDPVDRGVIYTVGGYGAYGLWKSTNGGVDWVSVFPQGSEVATVVGYTFIKSISIDASDHRHLVASMHSSCSAPYGASCHAESVNGGLTWNLLKNPMGDDWAEDTPSFAIGGNAILYSDFQGLWSTENHGTSWDKVGGMVLGANHRQLRPASDGFYYLPGGMGVLRSADGKSWSKVPNSGGASNDVAVGGGLLFTAEPNSKSYRKVSLSDFQTWTTIPPPPANLGAQQIDYDEVHHILYSSNFSSGLWRMVIQ
jgi:hypothetical protein